MAASRADRNGNTNSLRYNHNGTLASITDSQGRVTTFVYNDSSQLAKIIGPTGIVATSYTYTADGLMSSFTDRSGSTTTFEYNQDDILSALITAEGGRYEFAYNDFWGGGGLIEVRAPSPSGSAGTQFEYSSFYDEEKDDFRNRTEVTDANGNLSTYTFDDDKLVTVTDALGHTRSQTWTSSNDIAASTNGLGNSITKSYDSLGNLTNVQLATGAETSVGYASAAHPHLPTSITDPQGNKITRKYDSAGNLQKVHSIGLDTDLLTNYYGGPHNTLYSSTNANGAETTYEYDAAGNLITVTPPAPRGQTHYTYDSLSRVTSVTDGNGVRVEYAYDKLDRVVAISRDGTVLQIMQYDAVGNMTKRSVPGVTTEFTWATTNTVSQPISVTRIADGSLETVSYAYDALGNLIQLTDGGGSTSYAYDEANRLISLNDPFGQITTFGYDAANQRTSITFGDAGTQTMTYDAAGRQTNLTVTDPAGTEVFTAAYSYTTGSGADSNLLQSKTINGATTTYDYDSMARLTQAGSASFSYDAANNMTNRDGLSFTINAANQITTVGSTSVDFDGAGNVVESTNQSTSFAYSPTNQLLSVTREGKQVFRASYDSIDQTQRRSITETVNGTPVRHQFQQTALGITQVIDNDSDRRSYTRDPNGRLITERAADGTRYNLITDYQGSVLALLGTDGNIAATYTYKPYGLVTAQGPAADKNYFRWIGSYQLRSGLNLLGYRYYNSSWGRFTQPDPTHQAFNPYTYSGCDPINHSDPTGADYFACIGETVINATIIGAGGGAIFGSLAGGVGALPGALIGGGAGGFFGTISGAITCAL